MPWSSVELIRRPRRCYTQVAGQDICILARYLREKGHPSMSSPKIKVVKAPAPAESPSQAATQGTYKVFNRIVDWITNDRMQLLNITDRVNGLVRQRGVQDASSICRASTPLLLCSSTSGRTPWCTT